MSAVLISHPAFGSVWLSNVEYRDGSVIGEAWDSGMVGSPYYPDDYRGEPITMNFPQTCIRKREYRP